jgi:biopolymer transport protein ExbB
METEISFWQMLWQSGWAVYLLMLLSVCSLTMIAERAYRFFRARVNLPEFMGELLPLLEKGNHLAAANLVEASSGPIPRVVGVMLKFTYPLRRKDEEALARAAKRELIRLERFLPYIATIGSVSVFIGLFGTVIHIIDAFQQLGGAGSGGIGAVGPPLARALVATAMGIFVAVPAVFAFNVFQHLLNSLADSLEMAISAVRGELDRT